MSKKTITYPFMKRIVDPMKSVRGFDGSLMSKKTITYPFMKMIVDPMKSVI
jgi:hypothetical protein